MPRVSTVLIAVPHGGFVEPNVFARLFNQDDCGARSVLVPWGDGYRIDEKRNGIARRALAMGADYVLMVDSDVLLPPDALASLLGHGKEVVLGYYQRKGAGGDTDIVRLGAASADDVLTLDELSAAAADRSLLEVDAGGMGCALVSTDVFRRLGDPWFEFTSVSEDYEFCRRCRAAGIGVFVDVRLRCHHLRLEAV